MSGSVSPLAPAAFPELPAIAGVELATLAAGLRYTGRDDVLLASLTAGTTVAGVFTSTRCPSAPVDWCRQHIAGGTGRGLVVNSGNANAFTGSAGYDVAERTAQQAADSLGVAPAEVFLSSTGVIGELLSGEAMASAVSAAAGQLAPSNPEGWRRAADAIRTTDTFAKGSVSSVGDSTVVGIAKGSGMIAPDMATMLGYLFTDVAVDASRLQRVTAMAAAQSFNRITVDSDTSTSDTVLVFATGTGDHVVTDENEAEFAGAITDVMLDLAHQIVRDGEGATKFVSVAVSGAESEAAAETIARAIADSPLVKTALAAEDANWGRIVMAVGKSGEAADRDALQIRIGDELVAANGVVSPDYSEERATEHLRGDEVTLAVDVGVGSGAAVVWTCDLTHGYIDINAGYRS